MGANTKIEWCDHTLNLWWGCVEQGPECNHCYARTLAKRYGFEVWGNNAPRRYSGEKHLDQVVAWNRAAAKAGERQRVFVQSMGDICEIGRDEFDAARCRFFELVEQCKALDFLLLTKLPQNFRRVLPLSWWVNPRPNVVGMVTCGVNTSAWRVKTLLDTPFWRRGVSMEPLLEPVDLMDIGGQGIYRANTLTGDGFDGTAIDWVIVGGESGPAARPMRAAWARWLRNACAEYNVPFFFKQWGEWLGEDQDGAPADGVEIKEQVLNCTDEPLRVGRKKAGNLLDGRLHQEFYRPVEVAA